MDYLVKQKKELGNLVNRADEKVADVICLRGGNASNINRLQSNSGQRTLREVAEDAAKGDRNAKQIIKMIKQANTKGQRY